MKYNLFLIAIIVPFLFGCEDIKPNAREFPIIKTLEVTDINTSGATFRGEIIQDGDEPITSYGFIWDAETTRETDMNPGQKIIVGKISNKGVFTKRVDSLFSKGFSYRVKTFVTFIDQNSKDVRTVYSNIIKFKSEGTSSSAWSLIATGHDLKGIGQPRGSADNEVGYITFQNGESYSYNPERNEVKPLNKFPVEGGSYPQFMDLSTTNTAYCFFRNNGNIYKNMAGSWSKIATIPLDFASSQGYVHSYAGSDSLYFFKRYQSFLYILKSDKWEAKTDMDIVWSDYYEPRVGTNLKGKVYILNSGNAISEYDISSDKWSSKTQFPGGFGGQAMAFSYDNKIYFGICSPPEFNYDTNRFDKKDYFCRYDPKLNVWKRMQIFPDDPTFGSFFYFFLKDNFYRGYVKSNGDYRICKYDPSKE